MQSIRQPPISNIRDNCYQGIWSLLQFQASSLLSIATGAVLFIFCYVFIFTFYYQFGLIRIFYFIPCQGFQQGLWSMLFLSKSINGIGKAQNRNFWTSTNLLERWHRFTKTRHLVRDIIILRKLMNKHWEKASLANISFCIEPFSRVDIHLNITFGLFIDALNSVN